MNNEKTTVLTEVPVGEVFKVGNYEFIKFTDDNGQVIAVSKEYLYNSQFGRDNNLSTSEILEKLQNELLKELEEIVGADNIIEHEVDLLSLDGSDKYGIVKTKISLPTFDFYRHNVKLFERYKLDEWWWLATPESTSEHESDDWIVCVSPRGGISYDNCNGEGCGVRPFCIFNSNIFVSYGEE